MNTLLSKEIRLILPAYAAALLLTVAPMWFVSNIAGLCLFGFGTVLLALSSFGREFSLNTFHLLLAQPLERTAIWRTKIAVLAAALATVFALWLLSCAALVHSQTGSPQSYFFYDYPVWRGEGNPLVWLESFGIGGLILLVVFSGGLWTTLLLRQVTAPFWFTVLLPATIAMVVEVSGGNTTAIFVALVLYSAAGFWLARRLFFSAQETAWTGGIFLLPGLQSKGAAKISEIRSRRPWTAIIRKEFQLHQVGLAGIAVLFIVHLGTLLFHHGGMESKIARTAGTISDLCSMLWCVAPLFIGATSVAEERKMGMQEQHLCLPLSSRFQLAIKLAFVVVFGGLLSALLLWTKSRIGHSMVGMSDYVELKLGDRAESLATLSALFTGLSLLAFYASTLSRNLMQALVNAVAALLIVFGLKYVVDPPYNSWLNNHLPWTGNLVYFVGVITICIGCVWLSYRNFRQLPETTRLWRRNAIGMGCTLLFAGTATAALYNRAWELLTPLEPAHGPARLNVSQVSTMRAQSAHGMMLSLLLPDGRLWVNRIARYPSWTFSLIYKDRPYSLGIGGKWAMLGEKPFVPGSNWVDATAGYFDTMAIRSDGTLWASEKPRGRLRLKSGIFSMDKPDPLTQVGDDTNWKIIDSVGGGSANLLIKTDGTLWQWESWGFDYSKPWPGIRAFQPYQLGSASSWTEFTAVSGEFFMSGVASAYAWNASGQAWALTGPFNQSLFRTRPKTELEPGRGIERLQILDHTKWRSVTAWLSFDVGVREDGTLWIWDAQLQGNPNLPPQQRGKIEQMGSETNWVTVETSPGETLVGLKSDGTLWRWNREKNWYTGSQLEWPAAKLPKRMGTHNDWVAVCGVWGGVVSLAADGSLWMWNPVADYYDGELLIPPSRKPVKLCNIFDQE